MKDNVIRNLAAQAPTTKDELVATGLLAEQIIEDYGSRIVRCIKNYIETNNLQDQIAKHRSGKRSRADDDSTTKEAAAVVVQSSTTVRTGRPKAQKAAIEIMDNDDDEFEDDFDYSIIPQSDLF